jgi:hypothetical protein
VLESALASLDPEIIKTRPRLMAALATAHVRQGNIDEACRLGSQALDLAARQQVAPNLQDVRRLRLDLEPWGKDPSGQGAGRAARACRVEHPVPEADPDAGYVVRNCDAPGGVRLGTDRVGAGRESGSDRNRPSSMMIQLPSSRPGMAGWRWQREWLMRNWPSWMCLCREVPSSCRHRPGPPHRWPDQKPVRPCWVVTPHSPAAR